MKRTNSAAIVPFPHTAAYPDAGLAGVPTTRSAKPAVKKIVPYLAADVEKRIFDLATDRERSNNRFDTKLQAPRVYQDDPRRPGFFHLPQDILKQIIPRLDKHAMRTMASSCRTGYLIAEACQPMYRLPGLLRDLKRLRACNWSIQPESFKAFLHAIATGGAYDRALLSALSPGLRCAVAVAMQIWSHTGKLHRNNEAALIELNAKFIEENLNTDFLKGIEEIFVWLTIGQNRDTSISIALNKFFANIDMDVNIKSLIFTAFLGVICDTDIDISGSPFLAYIAVTHSLNLTIRNLGLLALLEQHDEDVFTSKLPVFLSNGKKENLKQDICKIIDIGIDKKLFKRLPTLRAIQITGFFLDAAQKLDETGKAAILARLISTFHALIYNYPRGLSDFDHAFNPENATKANLADMLEYANNHEFPQHLLLGTHVHLLTEQAAGLMNAKVAIRLVQRIYKAISTATTTPPHFDAYIARKIEELSMRC